MKNNFNTNEGKKLGNSFISKWMIQQLKSLAAQIKALGGNLYLDARKADGYGPLIGNESPWVDKANDIGKNLFNKGLTTDGFFKRATDGIDVASVNWFYSEYIDLRSIPDSVISGLANGFVAGFAYYDEDRVYISGENNDDVIANDGKLNQPIGTRYCILSNTLANKDITQLESGIVPTTYEPYARNDGQLVYFGGTLESGWNLDSPLIPYDDDTRQTLFPYQRVVDGIVYLKNAVPSTIGDVDYTVSESNVVNVSNNDSTGFRRVRLTNDSENKEYLLVCKARKISGADDPRIEIYTKDNVTLLASQNYTIDDQEERTLFTTTDSGFAIRMFASFVTASNQEKEYDVAIYPSSKFTDPLTDPLPPSGQYVSGNSKTDSVPVCRLDAIDDHIIFADSESLDITDAPLVLAQTIKVAAEDSGYITCKNEISSLDIQYGVLKGAGGVVNFVNGGVVYAPFSIGDDVYENFAFHWDGINVKSYRLIGDDYVLQNQTALVGPLVSSGSLLIGKRFPNDFFYKGTVCTQTIYSGAKVDIDKILQLEKKISKRWLNLNP